MRKSWPKITLNKVCQFKGGTGFREHLQGKKTGLYPFIKVSDLALEGNQKFIIKSNNWIDDDDIREMGINLMPPSSIVFAKVGAALKLNKRRILTRPTAIDNNMMATIPDTSKIDPEYLYYFMLTQDLGRFCQESAVPSINQQHIAKILILLPSLTEQKKIAAIIRTWDEAIEKLKYLTQLKNKQIKLLRKKLINKTGYNMIRISEFASEVLERNRNSFITRVLSVTNKNGFVLPEHQFGRRIASDNVSNYKVVRRGAYAYNPSRINVGSIARLDDWDEGILSPMYIVFILDENKINSNYFFNWLNSTEACQRIRNSTQGTVREAVNYTDLSAIKIPLPSLEKQKQIVEILSVAAEELLKIRRLSKFLEFQKVNLMQKLLTGEWPIASDLSLLKEKKHA